MLYFVAAKRFVVHRGCAVELRGMRAVSGMSRRGRGAAARWFAGVQQ